MEKEILIIFYDKKSRTFMTCWFGALELKENRIRMCKKQ